MANFFEDLQARKSNLRQIAITAHDYGWIDESRKNEIINKLDSDTLVMGIIGQMKCGKSTFLNAFVFEDDVLPAAATPMTAALTEIKYGEEKKIVAHFYNQDEWAEQEMQAQRNLDEITNELERDKVFAAKELVRKSRSLGGNVKSYLGKTQEDTFENLIEYVGVDGKYVSITKSVTVYYPKEYLKGVDIVDTPGFNDPIVSREERTKEFLKKADVVLLMLYAGQPFTASDRSILFQNVRSCGIGKVIIGANKYDIPYENGETSEQLQQYIQDEIRKACEQCNDNRLADILIDTKPILLSANMALLSEMPMCRIKSSDEYNTAWNRDCNIFEISNQQQFREYSHVDELIQAIKEMVEKEKGQILFAKPVNAILAAGNKKLEEIIKEINDCETKIVVYSTSNDELSVKRTNLEKAIKRTKSRISNLEDTLNDKFADIMRTMREAIVNEVDVTVRKLNTIVDNWGRMQSFDVIKPKIINEIDMLQTRHLRCCVEEQQISAQRKLRYCIDDFFAETDEIILKYLPDFDQRSFLDEVKRTIILTIDDDLFKLDPYIEDNDSSFWDFVNSFLDGFTLGLNRIILNFLAHDQNVLTLRQAINDLSTQFDASSYLQTISESKTTIIENVNKKYIEELLNPILTEFDRLVADENNRERLLIESKEKKTALIQSKATLQQQLEEINTSILSY